MEVAGAALEDEGSDKDDIKQKDQKQIQLTSKVDSNMQQEMLLQKRNIMMRLRQGDNEFKKYDMMTDNFDTDILEKKITKS